MMELNKDKMPRHVAIVMDGNGRWAKARGKDRLYGHMEGASSVRACVETARRLGIGYLTLYTFSIENFNRPEAEVSGLMHLLIDSINKETDNLIENDVRGRIIGDLSLLPADVQAKAREFEERTAHCRSLNLVLAIGYSARWEISRAARLIASDVAKGILKESSIDENLFSQYLSTAGIPDPDLLIRTGGELRISNYLLWQCAYTEFYFTATPWPEFREEAFREAIADYQSRERRFGKTSEQVKK